MRKLLPIVLVLGLMLSTSLMAFEPFTVKKIQVEGIARVSEDAVLRDMSISVGDTFTPAKANAAIHDLYKTGFFKEIDLQREGNTLIVKLVERPSIGTVKLIGLRSTDEVDKILKANNVVDGRFYDPNVISKVEREIIYKYLTEQRYGVKVDTKVIAESRNRVNLEINVYEGNVATIRQINFVGNKAFTDRQLRKQLLHTTRNLLSWFTKSDHYSKEKLAADLEIIRSFYMDRGYLGFKIESTQVSLSVDKKNVYITINVSEGDQFFFKQASVVGDLVIDPVELQAIVEKKIIDGKPFSRKAVWEAKDDLESRLGEDGYSKASVQIMDDIDPQTRIVGLKFYINAHKRITVRRITFEGNKLTQDQVLRRDIEQFEGSWISTKKVKEGKEAIMRDGFASTVDIETLPVLDKDDQVDLIYKIEEQRNASISAGISYSGADKVALNAGADLKNFVGTGKDINFLVNYGKAVQTYSLGYSDPYFTDSGIGFGGSLIHQRTRLSKTSNVFNYALDTSGINMLWRFRVSQYSYLRVGGGYDYTILKMDYNSSPTQAQYFVNQYNNMISTGAGNISQGYKEGYFIAGASHNSLDAFLFPTKGLTSNLDFKVSVPGSQLEVYRVDFAASWFRPLFNPVVLNIRANAGYANTYNGKPFPFFRHYYLGGGESVRGFQERSLGPKDSQGHPYGGNALVEGRFQFIFPPPFAPSLEDTMRLALFLDAGQVYDTQNIQNPLGQTSNPMGIRYSGGISVTWNTPMQIPIAFSLACPINKKRGDSTQIFAFSMGVGF